MSFRQSHRSVTQAYLRTHYNLQDTFAERAKNHSPRIVLDPMYFLVLLRLSEMRQQLQVSYRRFDLSNAPARGFWPFSDAYPPSSVLVVLPGYY